MLSPGQPITNNLNQIVIAINQIPLEQLEILYQHLTNLTDLSLLHAKEKELLSQIKTLIVLNDDILENISLEMKKGIKNKEEITEKHIDADTFLKLVKDKIKFNPSMDYDSILNKLDRFDQIIRELINNSLIPDNDLVQLLFPREQHSRILAYLTNLYTALQSFTAEYFINVFNDKNEFTESLIADSLGYIDQISSIYQDIKSTHYFFQAYHHNQVQQLTLIREAIKKENNKTAFEKFQSIKNELENAFSSQLISPSYLGFYKKKQSIENFITMLATDVEQDKHHYSRLLGLTLNILYNRMGTAAEQMGIELPLFEKILPPRYTETASIFVPNKFENTYAPLIDILHKQLGVVPESNISLTLK